MLTETDGLEVGKILVHLFCRIKSPKNVIFVGLLLTSNKIGQTRSSYGSSFWVGLSYRIEAQPTGHAHCVVVTVALLPIGAVPAARLSAKVLGQSGVVLPRIAEVLKKAVSYAV